MRAEPAVAAGRALLITHQRTSRVGRVGRLLHRRGYTLDIRCPSIGQPLPPSSEGYDLVVVFGGPMSVNDDDAQPGIAAELAFIPEILESGTPFLGICLGAQLLARVLGAEVRPHAAGLSQIGYAAVYPTAAGEAYFDGPITMYHWNSEGFDLPSDAALLAESATFPNQAFRYGTVTYGLQFHPDVTPGMVDRWTKKAAHHLTRPGAQSRDEQLAGVARYDRAIAEWFGRFLPRLLNGHG